MAVTGEIDKIEVFGTDYDTPDGTCIRDYIHVDDLADAHARALDHLSGGGDSVHCNLGTGVGVSVKEIISAVEEVTGKTVPVSYGAPPRGGSRATGRRSFAGPGSARLGGAAPRRAGHGPLGLGLGRRTERGDASPSEGHVIAMY